MTTPNRKLIEKADLAISDLTTDGGYLSDQQADKFIRLAIKESVLLGQISVTPMRGPREERDKIRFSGRVLKPASAGVALQLAERSQPDLSKFVLDVKEFKAEVRLNDSVLEDNIERGTFQDTVMAALSAAVARDVEYVAIQGDTTSGTALLAVLDGFLKQATTNIVNASSANLSKDILKDLLKALPDEFARIERLKYYTNRQARIDYRDTIAERMTGLGDAYLQQSDTTVYSDMPLVAIPEFPNSTATNVLLTDPQNLTVGFHRKIRFETDRDISAGLNIIVASIRFDVKIQEETAVAKATNVATT
jgi:HK97 family phage major capsid protein